MKTIGLTVLLILGMACSAAVTRESEFEESAYREIARFLKVEPRVVRNQQELSSEIERLIPLGTSEGDAFQKLREILAQPPHVIQIEWKLDRNPGGASVIFVDGNRGFGVTIVLGFDREGRVVRVRTGEFEF